MLVEAYLAVVDFRVLWQITSYRDGMVWEVEKTGYHIRPDEPVPEGYKTGSISAKPGELVDIIEYTAATHCLPPACPRPT